MLGGLGPGDRGMQLQVGARVAIQQSWQAPCQASPGEGGSPASHTQHLQLLPLPTPSHSARLQHHHRTGLKPWHWHYRKRMPRPSGADSVSILDGQNDCSSFWVSVRSPHADSFAMPDRTPSKAASRLWRWMTTSWHLNTTCATPWGWPHLQCLEDVGPTTGGKGAKPTAWR